VVRGATRWRKVGEGPTRPTGSGRSAPARSRPARAGGARGRTVSVETGEGRVADGWPPCYSVGWHGRELAADAWTPQHSTRGDS
jgi:hypothetical protein